MPWKFAETSRGNGKRETTEDSPKTKAVNAAGLFALYPKQYAGSAEGTMPRAVGFSPVRSLPLRSKKVLNGLFSVMLGS
jgi:hypothetical protein